MPKKNVQKIHTSNAYYHVYNVGLSKKDIFKDKTDFEFFEKLLERYLGESVSHDRYTRTYPIYRGSISLIGFCLNPKDFHLLLYQGEDNLAMAKFMRSLANSYTGYFNKKYRKYGPLFDGTYKASLIDNEDLLVHVSRYIILQSDKYTKWPYTSLPYFLGQKQAGWVDVKLMHNLFEKNPGSYLALLADEEGYSNSLKYINGILADR